MKKIFIMLFVLSLYGCEELTPSAAESIASSIEITYVENDSIQGITQNIELPTATELNLDANITWESLNETVITSEGVVNRQDEDIVVTLIMRVNVNGLYAQRVFNVTVLGLPETTSFTVLVNIFEQSLTYTLTEETPISDIPTPNIEGYVFIGWLDTNSNIIDSSMIIDESTVLVASFEAVITIQYSIEIYQENLDNTYELISNNSFNGTSGETIRFVETIEGFQIASSSITEITLSETDNILKIYYDRNVYQVIFYNEGLVYQTEQYVFGDVVDMPIEDSDIIGWSTYENGPEYDFTTEIVDDLNLYAVYEETTVSYTGYYASLDGVSDANLYQSLETLIQDYKYVSYGDARDILQISDEDPNNPNNIILVYNRASVRSTWDGGSTWNREHVWPRSLLNNSTAEDDPHNLKPSNPSINSSRGNDQFYDGSGTYGRVSGGWFPGEQDKGDVARIVFYVSLMWNKNISIIGNINTFLKWHQEDPVDDFEENRNDVLFQYTEHRNPYIDHPELVYKVYGQPSFLPFYLLDGALNYEQYLSISSEAWNEKNTLRF